MSDQKASLTNPVGSLFKSLSKDEEKNYRKWARDNYTPIENIPGIWHPVIQDECVRMNAGIKEDL